MIPFGLLLYWRIWTAAGLALVLAGTHWKAYTSGKKTVKAEWNIERLEIGRQSRVLEDKAAKTTAQLQADTDALRKTKNAQIAKLDARLVDALGQLRNRPDRPSDGGVPPVAGTGATPAGCTGAQLYVSDSEFSIREATRADKLRLALSACYEQYDNAREAVNP